MICNKQFDLMEIIKGYEKVSKSRCELFSKTPLEEKSQIIIIIQFSRRASNFLNKLYC